MCSPWSLSLLWEILVVYNYYMYTWCGSTYMSIYAIGSMCSNFSMCVYVDKNYIIAHFSSPCSPYNIVRNGFCVIIWYLSGDKLTPAATECHYMLVYLFAWLWFNCWCYYLWFYLCVDRLVMCWSKYVCLIEVIVSYW